MLLRFWVLVCVISCWFVLTYFCLLCSLGSVLFCFAGCGGSGPVGLGFWVAYVGLGFLGFLFCGFCLCCFWFSIRCVCALECVVL